MNPTSMKAICLEETYAKGWMQEIIGWGEVNAEKTG